jgi:hypothetical protein
MRSEAEVLDALIAEWQHSVAPYVRRDCCILAARVTSLVLDYYGIGNKVLACEAFVFNEAALDEMSKGNDDPKQWPPHAWSIGVGRHSPGGGYRGHLIVRTDTDALVDLSAAQFHRAGRIEVDGPRVWREVVHRNDVLIVREGSNVMLAFRASASPTYRNAPDWRHGKAEAARIIRALNIGARDA